MNTAVNENLCGKCHRSEIIRCDGCDTLFCTSCYNHHRREMSRQLNDIRQEHHELVNMFDYSNALQEESLFAQITTWEKETISKIQQIAITARNQLRQFLDETNIRTAIMFANIDQQLEVAYEDDDYTEKELTKWTQRLNNIQREVKTPLTLNILSDYDLSDLYDLNIETTTGKAIVQSRLIPSMDQSNDINGTDSQLIQKDLSDLTKYSNLFLFQASSSNEYKLFQSLNKFNDTILSVLNKTDDWLTQLKKNEQIVLLIDMSNILFKEQNDILKGISELEHIDLVYIQGILPESDADRKYFFSKYPFITAMFDNDQSLVVQLAIDKANIYKKLGDRYLENGDEDKSNTYFSHCITLYKRLSSFLVEKRFSK